MSTDEESLKSNSPLPTCHKWGEIRMDYSIIAREFFSSYFLDLSKLYPHSICSNCNIEILK